MGQRTCLFLLEDRIVLNINEPSLADLLYNNFKIPIILWNLGNGFFNNSNICIGLDLILGLFMESVHQLITSTDNFQYCQLFHYQTIQSSVVSICFHNTVALMFSFFAATSKLWNRGLYFPPQAQNKVSKEVCCFLVPSNMKMWFLLSSLLCSVLWSPLSFPMSFLFSLF